jgi:hypothetical protein
MTIKPEVAVKLAQAAILKEKGIEIIELDAKIKAVKSLEEEKKKITGEIVSILEKELEIKKTMNIDIPELNKRVIIQGRDISTKRTYFSKVEDMTKVKKK